MSLCSGLKAIDVAVTEAVVLIDMEINVETSLPTVESRWQDVLVPFDVEMESAVP